MILISDKDYYNHHTSNASYMEDGYVFEYGYIAKIRLKSSMCHTNIGYELIDDDIFYTFRSGDDLYEYTDNLLIINNFECSSGIGLSIRFLSKYFLL